MMIVRGLTHHRQQQRDRGTEHAGDDHRYHHRIAITPASPCDPLHNQTPSTVYDGDSVQNADISLNITRGQ